MQGTLDNMDLPIKIAIDRLTAYNDSLAKSVGYVIYRDLLKERSRPAQIFKEIDLLTNDLHIRVRIVLSNYKDIFDRATTGFSERQKYALQWFELPIYGKAYGYSSDSLGLSKEDYDRL